MKKKTIILTAMLCCTVITSMAQKRDVKEAVEEAMKIFKDIDNIVSMDADMPIEAFGYLLPAPRDIVAEEKNGLSFNTSQLAFIPPGEYTFGYRRVTTVKGMTTGTQVTQGNVSFGMSYTPTSQVKTKLSTVDVVIEAGKFYTTEYEFIRTKGIFNEDSITVFITELTDPEKLRQAKNVLKEESEKRKKFDAVFLQFQEQNPTLLEGAWNNDNISGRGQNLFIEYSFEGEKIKYKKSMGKRKEDNRAPIVAEGRLFYSENIIVFIPEKATINKGKEWVGFKNQPTYFWHYTINNDVLHLEKPKIKALKDGGATWPGGYTGLLRRIPGQTASVLIEDETKVKEDNIRKRPIQAVERESLRADRVRETGVREESEQKIVAAERYTVALNREKPVTEREKLVTERDKKAAERAKVEEEYKPTIQTKPIESIESIEPIEQTKQTQFEGTWVSMLGSKYYTFKGNTWQYNDDTKRMTGQFIIEGETIKLYLTEKNIISELHFVFESDGGLSLTPLKSAAMIATYYKDTTK